MQWVDRFGIVQESEGDSRGVRDERGFVEMKWLEIETCGSGESDSVMQIANEVCDETTNKIVAEDLFFQRITRKFLAGELGSNAGGSLSFIQHEKEEE